MKIKSFAATSRIVDREKDIAQIIDLFHHADCQQFPGRSDGGKKAGADLWKIRSVFPSGRWVRRSDSSAGIPCASDDKIF